MQPDHSSDIRAGTEDVHPVPFTDDFALLEASITSRITSLFLPQEREVNGQMLASDQVGGMVVVWGGAGGGILGGMGGERHRTVLHVHNVGWVLRLMRARPGCDVLEIYPLLDA